MSFTPKASIQFIENSELGNTETEFSFSVSGDFYYDLGAKIQLKSGFGIGNLATSQLDYSPLFGCDFDGNGGALQYNSYYKIAINSYYLEVPLKIKFKIIGEVNHVFIDFGIQNYFKINSSEKVKVYECGVYSFDLKNNSLFNHNEYLLTLNAGIGFESKLFKRQKLILEPVIEFALTKTYKEEEGILASTINNSKIMNLGLLLGIKF